MIGQPQGQDRQRTRSSALSSGENPYVGPRTFTRHEANRFFGREREARELRSLVIAERLVLFYAQSGAGKSSLLNTRLIPQLKESNFLVLPVGRVGGELPAGISKVDNVYIFNLLLSLDQGQDGKEADGNGGSDPRRFGQMTLVEFMRGLRTPDGDHYYFDEALAQSAPQTPTEEFHGQPPHLLIIDQFEELITNHPARWREREAFFRQLDAAMRADPLLWVVLTLREDFVPALDPYARLVTGGMRARFYMQRMGVDAALQAVRYPAEDAGRPFAAGVAETLVDNLRQIRMQGQVEPQPGQFVEPVQLQVVCYQLWEHVKDRPPGPITAADLDAAGDVDSALADFYESAIAAVLSDPKLDLSEHQLRNWFDTQLITEAGTRGIVYQGAEQTAGMPNNVVRRLQNQFLLRAELRAGGTWIELIHDRFVGPIQQANRRRQSPLAQDAAAWRAAGKPKARLYTGYQLAQAQQPVEENPQSFTALEREFVEAAINAEEVRKRRNRNLITAGSLLLVLLLGAAAIWAFLSRLEAVKANQDLALVNEELVAARTTEAELRQISDQATAAAVATSQEVALVARATYDAAVGEAIAFAQQQQELNVIRRTAEAMQSEATVVAGDLAFVLAALVPTPAVTPRGTRETILWIIASRLTPSPTVDANLLITVEAIQTRVSQSSAPTATATLPPPTPLPTPPPLLPIPPSITGTALALTPEPIPTETATSSPTAPASQLIGIVPAIPLSVFAQPDVNATVVARVNAGAEVSVLGFGTQNWVQVRTSAGSEGWMRGQFLTYRGDVSALPTDLAYRSIEDRTDLPFIEGEVAVSDWLLANPNAEETSGFRWIPAGTNVTVLLSGRGSTSYGSGVWYLVSLVDPENSTSIIQGWLPAEVVVPRGQEQIAQQQLIPVEPTPTPTAPPTATSTVTLTPTPVPVSWPPEGEILFASNRTNRIGDLFAIRPSTGGSRRLTENMGFEPSYSPANGGRIVFAAQPDQRVSIYTMLPDGSQVRNLTGFDTDNWEPTISPDGQFIAFVSSRNNLDWEIYTMRVDGSEVRQLTNTDPARNTMPSWSPDSSRIAFVRFEGDTSSIYTMNRDGTGLTRVITLNARIEYPEWSREGRQILFASNQTGNMDLYLINVDGSNLRNLTQSPADENFASWSPDGRWIAFARFVGNTDIFVMTVDGSQQTNITQSPEDEWSTTWIP